MRTRNFILKLSLVISFVFITTAVFGQNVTRGVVTSETGEPLIGVTVKLKSDPQKGCITDIDGNFMLSMPTKKEMLEFSYIGYNTREIGRASCRERV